MPRPEESPRFEPVRELGRGAMGVVWLVRDRRLGREVALKRLAQRAPAALLRLKREFRVAEGLHHPNLVELYELGVDEAGAYLVLEHVEGEGLRAHVSGRALEPTLARVLPQLADALCALHGAGMVHRDLKPSNVLVRADGVVKLLDFGLVTVLDEALTDEVAGSPAYMAPEQIRRDRVGAPTDVYALGATLFELTCGAPPFSGSVDEVLAAHLGLEPARVRALAPAAPAWLDSLVARMLAKDPAARPSLEEICAAADPARARRASRPSAPSALLGRAELEERLGRLVSDRGAPRSTVVTGASGVGKSALLDSLGTRARSAGHLVLRGGGRPTEQVPFNAVDGVVDDVARELARDEELRRATEPELGVAAAAFPVLAQTRDAARVRARELVRQRLFGSERQQVRRAAFRALFAVIEAAAARAPVLIVLDDLQWADEDSLSLLGSLLDRGSAGVRLVGALNTEIAAPQLEAWLPRHGGWSRLEVPELAPDDLAAIIRREAAGVGGALDEETARRAAAACGGRAFLATVLGRTLGSGLRAGPDAAALFASMLGALDLEDRRLLALLLANDEWLALDALGALGASAAPARVARLERAGLVRQGRSPRGSPQLDLYHHGVRQAAARELSPELLTDAHDRLATRLSASGAAPHRIVRHLLGAGRRAEAALAARGAAREATELGAFALAASLYEVALLEPGDDGDALLALRAEALERAGHYPEAAACWCELGSRAGGEARLEHAVREAHAELAAGRVARGLERLDTTLRLAGEPTTVIGPVRTLAVAARFVLGAPTLGQGGVGAQRWTFARAARDEKLGVLLAFLEPAAGVAYLQRARAGFERAGALERVAVADWVFAVLAHVGSRSRSVPPLARLYAARARANTPASARTPELVGMRHFVTGLGHMRAGRWQAALGELGPASAAFEHATGTSERLLCASWTMMCDVYRQELSAMDGHLARFRAHLAEVGTSMVAAHVDLLESYLELLRGRWAEAGAATERLQRTFAGPRLNTQVAAARLYGELRWAYTGDPVAAYARFERARREARRFDYLSSMYAGPIASVEVLLAVNALRAGSRAPSSRRIARLARLVERAPPFSAGAGYRALAYLADARGQPSRAVSLLERARAASLRFERKVDAAIAEHQLGLRLGGDRGAELRARALANVRAAGAGPALLQEDFGTRG